MKKLIFTPVVMLVMLVSACREEPKVIEADKETVHMTYEPNSGILTVQSNTDWTIASVNEWLTVTKTSSISSDYSAGLNKLNETRTAVVEISGQDAQTVNVTFTQEEFPIFKGWMRYGDGFREYFDFDGNLTGNYKWYNTVTLQYEEDRDFTFDFDAEKITLTMLDNYEEFIYFYSFSPDRLTLTLSNSYGDEYIYN